MADVGSGQDGTVSRLRVVLDAGHGGHDPGAIGPAGTREKDVALQIALQIANALDAARRG